MIEKHLRNWGIEAGARDASLALMEQARSACELMDRSGRGLFLYGPQGRGKTSLTTAILRVEIERWMHKESPYPSIQYVFVPDLIIELHSCFQPGSEKMPGDVIYRVSGFDFCVLDGMGEGGKPSEFVVGALGTLIHHREAARDTKRTVIASNYDVQELSERLDARIASRIAGMCEAIPFTGNDQRLSR